jgi:hypothetical protein
MNTIAICFKDDGTAHCLWTEAVPLHELGHLEITRASTIEFNNNNQQWEVRDLRNTLLFSDPSRETCLAWEQQHIMEGAERKLKLNNLLKQITPLPWLEWSATDGDKWIGTKQGDDSNCHAGREHNSRRPHVLGPRCQRAS